MPHSAPVVALAMTGAEAVRATLQLAVGPGGAPVSAARRARTPPRGQQDGHNLLCGRNVPRPGYDRC